MTVLFLGGEEESFNTRIGDVDFSSLGGTFNPAFARGAMYLQQGTDPIIGNDFDVSSEVWFHFDMRVFATKTEAVMQLQSGVNPVLRFFNLGGANSEIAFQYFNGSIWVSIAEDIALGITILYVFDIRCKINAVNGVFALYRDNEFVASFVGDTTLAVSAVDNFFFQGFVNNEVYVSQVAVKTTSTLNMKVGTYGIDADGTDQEWTGDFTDIDEVGLFNDTDFIDSDTNDEVSTFTGTFPATPTDFTIEAFGLSARMSRGTTGPQNIQFVTRSGGTVFPSANVDALDVGFENRRIILAVDPDTSLVWDDTSLGNAEFGVKAKT